MVKTVLIESKKGNLVCHVIEIVNLRNNADRTRCVSSIEDPPLAKPIFQSFHGLNLDCRNKNTAF